MPHNGKLTAGGNGLNILLIRHGQAGTRTDYDTLSATGRVQARLLGQYLAGQQIQFSLALTGTLRRQQQTASGVLQALDEAGIERPELTIDAGWSEFDLDDVYQSIGPQLALIDSTFAQHWRKAQDQIAADGHDENSTINRRWNPADELVVRAWVQGKFPCSGESWLGFKDRIRDALSRLLGSRQEGTVAIFTSATPSAICTARALGAGDDVIFQLAGSKMNSAITELRARAGNVRLFAFNSVPHLPDASLRTQR